LGASSANRNEPVDWHRALLLVAVAVVVVVVDDSFDDVAAGTAWIMLMLTCSSRMFIKYDAIINDVSQCHADIRTIVIWYVVRRVTNDNTVYRVASIGWLIGEKKDYDKDKTRLSLLSYIPITIWNKRTS
jgi:hypothetical protein